MSEQTTGRWIDRQVTNGTLLAIAIGILAAFPIWHMIGRFL